MKKKNKTVEYIESFLNNDYESLKKNLIKLLNDYKKTNDRLDRIIKQSDRQQLQILQMNEELNLYKNHLEQKVEEEIQKRKEKEKMLLQQSKLAAMGEMMDAVAHQWKQPINSIKMYIEMLGYDYEDNMVDQEYINNFQQRIFSQIDHIINTLNEFRSFFRPNKETKEFDVKEMVDKVLLLVKDEFLKNQITVKINEIKNFKINGVENEFKHLILNIINNAKDAFNDNNIKKRLIEINIISDDKENKIEIIDNAGGIPEHIIDNIFDANFTTKEEGKGTGIGLYMSKQIAQKHNGDLIVQNVENGAKFTFLINK